MKAVLFLSLALAAGLLRAEGIVFIAHPSTVDASLNDDALKSILTGAKTKWDSGTPLKLGIVDKGPVHEKVVRDLTQRTPDQFDKFWKKLVFTGKGMPPTTFATDEEALAWVAKTPGALAYVSAEKAGDQVKIVATK